MKSQTAAFDQARSALRCLGIPEVLPALHAAGVGITRKVLGGSHSVAIYPPIDSLIELDGVDVINTMDSGREASLYIHIAFCETRCSFCHYVVDHYAGPATGLAFENQRVARYLDALEKELVEWGTRLARAGTAISSVYIGGGTPLILEEEALRRILRRVRHEYNLLPDAEVCIEGSPLTITACDGAEKLRVVKSLGVTRLSFGVQSFDDNVLRYAARGYKREVAVRASIIASENFENWNLDLIQGLYQGSPFETYENLNVIADIRPPHLTWYHGRFADRPQGDWYKLEAKRTRFEDEEATLLGRMLIWQELASMGYCQTDGNRFVRERHYTDPFKKVRTSPSSNLIGIGAASYSHTGSIKSGPHHRGYVFRNESNIRAWEECVLRNKVPIVKGRIIDDDELLATSYATGLRQGRAEDEELRLIRRNRPELSSHYENLAKQLINLRVLENYSDENGREGSRLSDLGRLFEDETLALFFSPAVKRMLAAKALDVDPTGTLIGQLPASGRLATSVAHGTG